MLAIVWFWIKMSHSGKVNYNINAIQKPSEPMGGNLRYSEYWQD